MIRYRGVEETVLENGPESGASKQKKKKTKNL